MKRLEALEGLRGHAVLLVFLVHACGYAAARLYGIEPDSAAIADLPAKAAVLEFFFRSHYGVDLFFVLSGLLMADIAARRWPGTATFLGRRALRIYPAYAASVVLAFVAVWWFAGHGFAWRDLAANAVFLHGFFGLGFAAVNPVTWSLSYEAAFYILVPFIALAWHRREAPAHPHAPAYLAVAFALIVAIAAALPGERTVLLAYFALFVPGLAIGLLDADARLRAARRVPSWLAAVAWIAFTLAVKLEVLANTRPPYFFASALACGLLVLKCCDPDSFAGRLFSTRAFLALGRISYSFFLVHYIVLHVLGHFLPTGDDTMARATFALSFFAGGFVLSALAAWALFQLAERFYFARRPP